MVLAETCEAFSCAVAPENIRTNKSDIVIPARLGEVRHLMKRGRGRKEADREVSEAYGVSKTELYNRSLGLESA